MAYLYCVYDAADRIVCLDATAQQAASAMGVTYSYFRSVISAAHRSDPLQWTIMRIPADFGPNDDYVTIHEARSSLFRLFTVVNKQTDEIVAEHATAAQCTKKMGLKNTKSFYPTFYKAQKGLSHKWRFVDEGYGFPQVGGKNDSSIA